MILLQAVKADMVPCVKRLSSKGQTHLLLGITLSADFNFGQLAQAENAPASLSGLLFMRSHLRAFSLRFLEQILDVAGAAGHMDHTCAAKLVEPIYRAYHNVHDVAQAIISRTLSLRQGYDMILTRRNDLLTKNIGFRKHNINLPADRALLRLLCMASASDIRTVSLYHKVYMITLDKHTRDRLIMSLNFDGSAANPAVQPTYMPAMLLRGLRNTDPAAYPDTLTFLTPQKQNALTALLRYLARVLDLSGEEKPIIMEGRVVTVVERNVLGTLKDVLGSEEWRRDPEGTLEGLGVPGMGVAKFEEN